MKLYTGKQVIKAIELTGVDTQDASFKANVSKIVDQLTPIELFSGTEDCLHMLKVRPVQDDTGDWYILPNELVKEFYKDQDDEDFVDSGEFGKKYGLYNTGGDLNNIQLHIDINDLK